jgi:hypothetical protein
MLLGQTLPKMPMDVRSNANEPSTNRPVLWVAKSNAPNATQKSPYGSFQLSRVSSLYGTSSPVSESLKSAERLSSDSLAEAATRSWLLESLATFVEVSIH